MDRSVGLGGSGNWECVLDGLDGYGRVDEKKLYDFVGISVIVM